MKYLKSLLILLAVFFGIASPTQARTILVTPQNKSSFVYLGGTLRLTCNTPTGVVGSLSRNTLEVGAKLKTFAHAEEIKALKRVKSLLSDPRLSQQARRKLSEKKRRLEQSVLSIRTARATCRMLKRCRKNENCGSSSSDQSFSPSSSSRSDSSLSSSSTPSSVASSTPGSGGDCSDGIDNDGDLLTDSADLGCAGGTDEAGVGATATGWTVLRPSADSRIVYVSSSDGNDANDGSFERPVQHLAKGISLLRSGMPDWLLLKRGDTWTNESLSSLSKSGRSAQERMVITSYGPSTERPLIETGVGITAYDSPTNHHAFIGLHFDAHTRDPRSPAYVDANDNSSAFRILGGNNILIEDCFLEHYGTNIIVQVYSAPIDNFALRRSIIVDASAKVSSSAPAQIPHSQGLYLASATNTLIEENVFDHNGWDLDTPGGEPTMFNHNLYLNGLHGVILRNNITTHAASMGTKLNANESQGFTNGIVENNFYAQDEIAISMGGHLFDDTYNAIGFVDIDVLNNVVTNPGLVSPNARGLTWGFGITGQNIRVENNYFLNSPTVINTHALDITGNYLSNASIQNNVVYNWNFRNLALAGSAYHQAVRISNNYFQDQQYGSVIIYYYNVDSGFQLSNNHYFSNSASPNWFRTSAGLQDFNAWNIWSGDQNSTSTAFEFTDSTRSVEKYDLEVLGGEGTLEGFIAKAKTLSRFDWNSVYTANGINEYLRTGFAPVGR